MGAMLMNMAANMLGLGNAATPLGLRAMRDLESLNPHPGTATNAMCTFLAINTSSIQLIPATAIAILAANHSNNPTAIVGTSIVATTCAALAAVASAKALERLPMFRMPPPTVARTQNSIEAKVENSQVTSPLRQAALLVPLDRWRVGALIIFILFFAYLFVRLAFPAALASWPAPFAPPATAETPFRSAFVRVVDAISKLSIPFLLSIFPLYAMLRQVKVYEEFVEGAKEGFEVAIKIIPYLVAILVAIGMFRAAGGIELLNKGLGPIMSALGFPSELLQMVLMRPLSGSGTLGLFADLVKQHGPDTLISRMGGTIYGSTETTFYVLAVYFGSVGVTRSRYALLAGLTADFVGVIASVIICKVMFG